MQILSTEKITIKRRKTLAENKISGDLLGGKNISVVKLLENFQNNLNEDLK